MSRNGSENMAGFWGNTTTLFANKDADVREFTPPPHPEKTPLVDAKMWPRVVVVYSPESYTAMPILSFHRRSREGKESAEGKRVIVSKVDTMEWWFRARSNVSS